jgi:hypothetical protein
MGATRITMIAFAPMVGASTGTKDTMPRFHGRLVSSERDDVLP